MSDSKNLRALRIIAEKATAPKTDDVREIRWVIEHGVRVAWQFFVDGVATVVPQSFADCFTPQDAEFIATFNPRAVIELLDEIENGTCRRHANQKHGAEAEELRRGIEQIVANLQHVAGRETRVQLQALLDRIDARDSLSYLEAQDEKSAMVRAALDEALDGWRKAVTAITGIPGRSEREQLTRITLLRALVSGTGPTAIEYLRNEISELKARVTERDAEIARLKSERDQYRSTFHGGPG